jgi:hypothetical protein
LKEIEMYCYWLNCSMAGWCGTLVTATSFVHSIAFLLLGEVVEGSKEASRQEGSEGGEGGEGSECR